MVVVGDTEALPAILTAPTIGLIYTDVALDTAQLKDDELPAGVTGGVAVNELTIGRPAGVDDDDVPETRT